MRLLTPVKLLIIGFVLFFLALMYVIFELNQPETDTSFVEETTTRVVTPAPTLASELRLTNTYTNVQYRYSISYPEDWEYREYPDTKSGAGFYPSGKPDDYQSEYVTIDVVQRPQDMTQLSFDEYVKQAGPQEIQGYTLPASFEKFTTDSGITAYNIRWQNTALGEDNIHISNPRSYYPMPDKQTTATIQLSLTNHAYENVYNAMRKTFQFTQ